MAVVIGLDGGGTGTSVIVEDLGSLKNAYLQFRSNQSTQCWR